MKTKDIITLVVATLIIAVSVFFIVRLLSPSTNVNTAGTKSTVVPVPEQIDDSAFKSVSDLKDYGKPALSGLGKSDLFAGF